MNFCVPPEYAVALYRQRGRIAGALAIVTRPLGPAYFGVGSENGVSPAGSSGVISTS